MKPIWIILSILFLVACNNESDVQEQPIAVDSNKQDKPIVQKEAIASTNEGLIKHDLLLSEWMQGKVIYLDLEGGFYGIITDNGGKILPMNLTKEFQQYGAIVKFRGESKDIATIQQWGQPFLIKDIKLIKKGSGTKAAEM